MSSDYVFDTEPLIAQVFDEPGATRVEEILADVYDGTATASMSEITATEFTYKSAWLLADGRPDDDHVEASQWQLQNFLDQGVELRTPTNSWETAARVKASGGIALGDAFAVALADQDEATLVVGADGDFADLSLGVTVERIRDDPA